MAAIGATLRVLVKHRPEAPVATTVTAALVGITITGAIGGAVVLSELSPALRTLHLMLAETVALLLVHATVATFYTRNNESRRQRIECIDHMVRPWRQD